MLEMWVRIPLPQLEKDMRKFKRVEKTYLERQLDILECDICHDRFDSLNWDEPKGSDFDVDTTVECKRGYSAWGDAWGEGISFDICPTCFKEKLVPWVESHGSKVTEWDW